MAAPFQKATYMKLQMIVFGLITGLLSCFLVHAQTTLMTNGLVAYYPFDNDIYVTVTCSFSYGCLTFTIGNRTV